MLSFVFIGSKLFGVVLLCFGLCLVVLGCVFVDCVRLFWVVLCVVELFSVVVACFALFDLVFLCTICSCFQISRCLNCLFFFQIVCRRLGGVRLF